MPEKDSAASEILGYSFLRVFADEDVIDGEELRFIERLALRDGVVDSRERAVLSRIFDRIESRPLDREVREAIEAFRKEHNIR